MKATANKFEIKNFRTHSKKASNNVQFQPYASLRHSSASNRFQKHKNKIEANKENFRATVFCQMGQKPSKYSYGKIKGLDASNQRLSPASSLICRKCCNLQETKSNCKMVSFQPKGVDQIKRKNRNLLRNKTLVRDKEEAESDLNTRFYDDQEGLSKLLLKNNIKSARCLVGQNIPKIQSSYQFSRFELYNLYSSYKSLLAYSKSDLAEFRKGFENVLHINSISLNSQMVCKCFSNFQEDISFSNFIKVYGNLQSSLFVQTIIEYLGKIFPKHYRSDYLSAEQILASFKEKIEESSAHEIKTLIYEMYNRSEQEPVQLEEIYEVCHESKSFCLKIFHSINQEEK